LGESILAGSAWPGEPHQPKNPEILEFMKRLAESFRAQATALVM
jgi:hypothetical protein